MSKVVYFGVPAHGHTNPSLGFVRELVRNGEKVIYYSFPGFSEKIIATGAEYRESPGVWGEVDQTHMVSRLSFLYLALLEGAASAIAPCIEIIKTEKPDYVIHDSLAPWGKYAALVTGTPAVASISTFIFRSRSISLRSVLYILSVVRPVDVRALAEASKYRRFLRKQYGITGTGFLSVLVNTAPLNIVYTTDGLQPNGASFDPSQFKFIGPSIFARSSESDEPDYARLKKPLIYLSFGTIHHGQANFYKKLFVAFDKLPGTIVLSAGPALNIEDLAPIPPNFVVLPAVNQMEVLRNTDVFVTHGGMNSFHESLYCGVPMVVIPFHEEQRTVARRCAELGCGLHLPGLDSASVYEAVVKVAEEPKFRRCALELSSSLRNSGGVKEAVAAVFEHKAKLGIA